MCGYYRKIVPRFSDIAQPLSKVTAHDAVFVWCEQCELSFQMLKDTLVSAPILKIPGTSKQYTIFTDASKSLNFHHPIVDSIVECHLLKKLVEGQMITSQGDIMTCNVKGKLFNGHAYCICFFSHSSTV